MPFPAPGLPPALPDWEVVVASAPGKAHAARNLPNQDAARWSGDARALTVAVADGHGHERHFRSGRGAALAVEVACAVGDRLGPALAAQPDDASVARLGRDRLVDDVVAAWAAAVDADLGAHPFDADEEARARRYGDPPTMAYGSTLLTATIAGRWALLAQIGDGDIMTADGDGTARSPVPADPVLDGLRTTSLCQPDAADAFRVAALDVAAAPVALILLASDGYGNAQVDEIWQPAVGADLIALLRQHGPSWIRRHLPDWVARCASAEGAADDTTVAIVVAPGRSGPVRGVDTVVVPG